MGWCYWNVRGSACSKHSVVLAWRRCPWVVPPASDLALSSFLVRIRIPCSSRNIFSRPKVGRKKNWFFLEITKWNQKCTPGRTNRPGAILCLLETPHCVGLAMHVSPGVRKGIVLRPQGTRLVGHVPHRAGTGGMGGPGQLFLQMALLKVHFSFMARSAHTHGVA